MKKARVIIIVLDSLGVGELPDASFYGDVGSNTLSHIGSAVGGLHLPVLETFGLGCITDVAGVACTCAPVAAYGKMAERSKGKDTTTGHWEMTGVILEQAFPVYAEGFPPEILNAFEEAIGRSVLGNVKASGTEIIDVFGEQHMASGQPIVYTSADSVFQVAAHEEVVPLEELYRWCKVARNLLVGEHAVGRVIARPFIGKPGQFQRTPNRKDYSLLPPVPTVLDRLVENGVTVLGIGKIPDIFAGRGVTIPLHTKNNDQGMDMILKVMREHESGLIFTNLVDFDMIYGHRNDAVGYGRALESFDRRLPEVLAALQEDDVLFVTADHGCDPTFPHTDHTREYVPLMVYGKRVNAGSLGIRTTFADLGATVCALFDIPAPDAGQDFSKELGL